MGWDFLGYPIPGFGILFVSRFRSEKRNIETFDSLSFIIFF